MPLDIAPVRDYIDSLTPPPIRRIEPIIAAFVPIYEGNLVAVIEVTWPDDRIDHEVRYYREGNRRWITPATRFLSRDRSHWLTTFVDMEAQQKYQDQILAAVDLFLAGGDDHVR